MAWREDDTEPPCVDCALGRHCRCRDLDPAPLGERECCCGVEADVKVYVNGVRQ